MNEKEYIFIGTAQNKTRTYIKMLEDENRKLKSAINNALQKLKASENHFKAKRENNVIIHTINILEKGLEQ